MPHLFGETMTRREFLKRVGSPSQIGGLKRIELSEGVGKGTSAVEVRTGAGLDFTVLLDRGMDISSAHYRGLPLAWLSPSGESNPNRFEPQGVGWLRTFPGGLVTTCGLRQTGAPCQDEGEDLGAHGRYTSLPASAVSLRSFWEEDDFLMEVQGEVREAVIFGENLVLRRTLRCRLGSPGFSLHDEVTNEGFSTTPHMILYHCNFGFPLLGPSALLQSPATEIIPRDSEAAEGAEDACRFQDPTPGYREKVYFHRMQPDESGRVAVRLGNPTLGKGLVAQIRYRIDQLPYFTQWKMMGEGTYVCGLEPGNATVLGRAEERRAGRLTFLEPGESRCYDLDFSVEG